MSSFESNGQVCEFIYRTATGLGIDVGEAPDGFSFLRLVESAMDDPAIADYGLVRTQRDGWDTMYISNEGDGDTESCRKHNYLHYIQEREGVRMVFADDPLRASTGRVAYQLGLRFPDSDDENLYLMMEGSHMPIFKFMSECRLGMPELKEEAIA